MSSKKLKFVSDTNMYGTTINLVSRDSEFSQTLVENFNPANPLKNMNSRIRSKFYFRNPIVADEDWDDVFSTLANCQGKFSLKTVLHTVNDRSRIEAHIQFENEDDGAVFAWTHVAKWQKWSEEKSEEEKSAEKERAKNKLKVYKDKDGKLKVKGKVSVATLGK